MTDISAVLTNVVSDLLDEYEYDEPKRLNQGDCVTVADRVTTQIPEAEKHVARWVFEQSHYRRYPAHTWVEYEGRHYDAEAISGVYNWHDLPIFRRGIPIDAEHVKAKYRTDALSDRL